MKSAAEVQNTDKIDYVKCSIELAKSIKLHNRENKICIVTDKVFESEYVDVVKVMNTDESAEHNIKTKPAPSPTEL